MPEEEIMSEEEIALEVERTNYLIAIFDAKEELKNTDYVVIKMYEAVIRGEDITSMKSEYSDVLNHRQQLRQQINELKEQIKSLN